MDPESACIRQGSRNSGHAPFFGNVAWGHDLPVTER